jgi:hypothetical protein
MLQIEESRALKKINDTKKKAQDIMELKMKNDEKFAKQYHDNQVYNSTLRMTQTLNY